MKFILAFFVFLLLFINSLHVTCFVLKDEDVKSFSKDLNSTDHFLILNYFTKACVNSWRFCVPLSYGSFESNPIFITFKNTSVQFWEEDTIRNCDVNGIPLNSWEGKVKKYGVITGHIISKGNPQKAAIWGLDDRNPSRNGISICKTFLESYYNPNVNNSLEGTSFDRRCESAKLDVLLDVLLDGKEDHSLDGFWLGLRLIFTIILIYSPIIALITIVFIVLCCLCCCLRHRKQRTEYQSIPTQEKSDLEMAISRSLEDQKNSVEMTPTTGYYE